MRHADSPAPLTRKVIDSLHVEAMVLADEARSYFDGVGLADRSDMSPRDRVLFSCEALKVTTRLMHSVAWLLSQRAYLADRDHEVAPVLVKLGIANRTDAATAAALPDEAARIVATSTDIYDRIERIDASMRWTSRDRISPAHALHAELERLF